MKKFHLAILKNEIEDNHLLWIQACEERRDAIDWEVIDITKADWLEKATAKHFDGFLAMPPAFTMPFKTLFDERVNILNNVCKIPIYPSLQEISIYENKKFLSYWLAANQIPHPATKVFYYEAEALEYLDIGNLPIVAKTSIGASGRGVTILKIRDQARQYVRQTFSGGGAQKSVGPKWKKKGFVGRVIKKMLRPQDFKLKLQQYKNQRQDLQKDFVIFQEFIPHTFEWRCVRIGDSFFAHKKIVKDEKASGSLIKGYENPPLDLFDFFRDITEKHQMWSQAIDIFETKEGEYLVNEMQCIFGQSDPYQMLVNGQPGRYLYEDGHWVFEPGDFNRYESYLLRVDHFINILSRQTKQLLQAL